MPSLLTEACPAEPGAAAPADRSWTLLVEPDGRCGAEQMAVDEALLDAADRTGRAFLRLYRFAPPCLSLGRHESAARRYDRAAIARLGIDVVRRPTGGRAVWHEHALTYAVAAPLARFGSPRTAYRAIHARLAAALALLGARPTLAPERPRPAPGEPGTRLAGSCFARAAGGEVLVGGRKVVGSAQALRGRALLQHGAILLAGSQDVARAVGRAPQGPDGATTLAAALGRPVAFGEVADAIARAWGEPLAAGTGPEPEPERTARFRDAAWTWRR
jgi:lipoate-protein ligase A